MRHRAVHLVALATAMAALPACAAATARPAAPAPAAASSLPHALAVPAPELGIENAARMGEGLYRGAQPDAAGLRTLKERGFRTVVNLRSWHSERREAEALGLRVVEIPMRANLESVPPTDEQVRRFLDVARDPANRPVFFHCAQGKDRTGVMAAVYRMEVDGWTNEEALAEMRRFGFHETYRDLEAFVRSYGLSGSARK